MAGVTAIGNDGIENIPSLKACCDLFRAVVNDTFNDGEGQIATDDAPFFAPLLNSAIRDLYAELRLLSDMRVVRDNYLVSGIPGLATADPTVQVALTYRGYFDGFTWSNQWLLPPDLLSIRRVWQRNSGQGTIFYPLRSAGDGIDPLYQDYGMGSYELRGANELWFSGSTIATDLRLRYTAVLPDLASPLVDYTETYIPIPDCTNAIAFKMVAIYAQRLSPDQFSLAESQANKFTAKLLQESVLNSQTEQFARL